MSTTIRMRPSPHQAQSYPQELSTGSPVSRETRRRTLAAPVDRAVDEAHGIGVVSRETGGTSESTGATHRLWIVAGTHVWTSSLINSHNIDPPPRLAADVPVQHHQRVGSPPP